MLSIIMRQAKSMPPENIKKCLVRLVGSGAITMDEFVTAGNEVPGGVTLDDIKEAKLIELSSFCESSILDGITITTEDGVERHFAGDEQDQINIDQVLRACDGGAPGWLYQSEGEDGQAGECFWCTATDAKKISNGLAIDKTEKRTRHNIMKKMVLSLTTVEEVLAVQWGQPLTGQWLEEYNTKMGLLTPIIESMGGGGNAGG